MCNMPSLAAFRACETQWRVVGTMAAVIWIGLDYTACQIVLTHMNAAPYVFDDLRFMESEALSCLNEDD